MIIRIRSNLAAWKVNVPDNCNTIEDLQTEACKQFNVAPGALRLSQHQDGDVLDEHATFKELNIKHGDMLYVVGKLREIVVEKSYIEDGGTVVGAGKRIISEEAENPKEPVNTSDSKNSSHSMNEVKKNWKLNDEVCEDPYLAQVSDSAVSAQKFIGSGSREILEDGNPSVDADLEADAALAAALSAEPMSPEVRKPDEAKRMRLYDDDTEDDIGNISDNFMGIPIDGHFAAGIRSGNRVAQTFIHGARPAEMPSPVGSNMSLDPETISELRAAGLDMEEIQHAADEMFAERLQAHLISEDDVLDHETRERDEMAMDVSSQRDALNRMDARRNPTRAPQVVDITSDNDSMPFLHDRYSANSGEDYRNSMTQIQARLEEAEKEVRRSLARPSSSGYGTYGALIEEDTNGTDSEDEDLRRVLERSKRETHMKSSTPASVRHQRMSTRPLQSSTRSGISDMNVEGLSITSSGAGRRQTSVNVNKNEAPSSKSSGERRKMGNFGHNEAISRSSVARAAPPRPAKGSSRQRNVQDTTPSGASRYISSHSGTPGVGSTSSYRPVGDFSVESSMRGRQPIQTASDRHSSSTRGSRDYPHRVPPHPLPSTSGYTDSYLYREGGTNDHQPAVGAISPFVKESEDDELLDSDFSRAIELSLQDTGGSVSQSDPVNVDTRTRQTVNTSTLDPDDYIDMDEQFARALHESWNSMS